MVSPAWTMPDRARGDRVDACTAGLGQFRELRRRHANRHNGGSSTASPTNAPVVPRTLGIERSLDDLDVRIEDAKKAARFAPSLPDKLRLQREVKTLESRRDEA